MFFPIVASLNTRQEPAHPAYLPFVDGKESWPALEPFSTCTYKYSDKRLTSTQVHDDPGLRANPAKPNLVTPNTSTTHLSPDLGTEIKGVQISELSQEGLDELALYAAERKVLIFRDQNFKDIGPGAQLSIAK